MKQTKFRINLDGLEEIKKGLSSSMRARVGILGAHAARTDETKEGLNNATLGLIQMFGSITNNIPPRDFLIMPITLKRREIIKAMGSGAARAAFEKKDFKKLFTILGQTAEGFVLEAFSTGGYGRWAPNKPQTIKRKGSSAPLIDTAELRKSITSDVVNNASTTAAITAVGSP